MQNDRRVEPANLARTLFYQLSDSSTLQTGLEIHDEPRRREPAIVAKMANVDSTALVLVLWSNGGGYSLILARVSPENLRGITAQQLRQQAIAIVNDNLCRQVGFELPAQPFKRLSSSDLAAARLLIVGLEQAKRAMEQEERSHGVAVKAPFACNVWHAPSPGAKTFVEPGGVVQAGSTIVMLDAMKCFSELPAPVTGRLSEMLVANGSLADVDETICFIVPSGDEE